jgi:hypothetical protein
MAQQVGIREAPPRGFPAAGGHANIIARTTAFKGGESVAPMRLLRPLADQGNALAQTNVGLMFHDRHGAPQDYAAREASDDR